MCFGIRRLRAHGEYVEDERGAVEDFYFQFPFDVAQLFGAQLVVEDDHADFAVGFFLLFDVLAYFVEFPFAYIGGCKGLVESLGEALDGAGAGCLSQESQLVEVFVRFALVLCTSDEGYQYGGFGLCF